MVPYDIIFPLFLVNFFERKPPLGRAMDLADANLNHNGVLGLASGDYKPLTTTRCRLIYQTTECHTTD